MNRLEKFVIPFETARFNKRYRIKSCFGFPLWLQKSNNE